MPPQVPIKQIRMPKIVGAGNLTVDRIARVSSIPQANESAVILEKVTTPGGATANVIVCLQTLGYDTGLIARIGNNQLSHDILGKVESKGVDCSQLQLSDDEEITFTNVYTDGSGDQVVIAGGDSALNLTLEGSDLDYCRSADFFHTSGYAVSNVLDNLERIDTAVEHISFDLAASFDELPLRGYSRELIDEKLPLIDMFVAQEPDLLSYKELDDTKRAINELLESGVEMAAVTQGSDGAILATSNRQVSIPSFDVDIVDTTGAGDAFTAGLIHASAIESQPLRYSGRFANAMAALNCRTKGGQRDIPTIQEVRNLIQ